MIFVWIFMANVFTFIPYSTAGCARHSAWTTKSALELRNKPPRWNEKKNIFCKMNLEVEKLTVNWHSFVCSGPFSRCSTCPSPLSAAKPPTSKCSSSTTWTKTRLSRSLWPFRAWTRAETKWRRNPVSKRSPSNRKIPRRFLSLSSKEDNVIGIFNLIWFATITEEETIFCDLKNNRGEHFPLENTR